ncbi:MAG: hypothetical protein ACOX33_09925 [Dethiobacteria bacterium]
MRDAGVGSYYVSIKALGDGVSSYRQPQLEVYSSPKEIIQLAAPTNLALSDAPAWAPGTMSRTTAVTCS